MAPFTIPTLVFHPKLRKRQVRSGTSPRPTFLGRKQREMCQFSSKHWMSFINTWWFTEKSEKLCGNSPTQVICLKLMDMVVDQLSNKKSCLWTEITVSAKNVVQRATSQNRFLPACLDKIKVPPPECSASRRWTTRHFPSCGSVATFITNTHPALGALFSI